MMKRERRDRPEAKMMTLFRKFEKELRTRAWGEESARKTITESEEHGEAPTVVEKKITLKIFAAVARCLALKVLAAGAIEILEDISKKEATLSARVFSKLIRVMKSQASLAVSDAQAALRAATRRQKKEIPARGRTSGTMKTKRFVRALAVLLKATKRLQRAIGDVAKAVQFGIRRGKELRVAAATQVMRDLGALADGVQVLASQKIEKAVR